MGRIKQDPGECTRILYLGSLGRSGSTILANSLAECGGFEHFGEICFAWHFGARQNFLCSCGESFKTCLFWSEVCRQAFGGIEKMHRFEVKRPRSLEIFANLLGGKELAKQVYRDRQGNLDRLYRAIKDVSGCQVIVDSSKFPAHAYLLQQIPSVRLYLVHLVRDPRGTAHSWKKHVAREDMAEDKVVMMPRYSSADTALKWVLWNWELELIGRRGNSKYMRVRYEDFVQKPHDTLKDIVTLAEADPTALPAIQEGHIPISQHHAIGGNPIRQSTGNVQLIADQKWKRQLGVRDRITVGLFSWPFMVRYGYGPF